VNHPIIEFIFLQSEIIKPDFNIHVPEVLQYEKGMNLKGRYMSCDDVYKILFQFMNSKKHSDILLNSLCTILDFDVNALIGKSSKRQIVRQRYYIYYQLLRLGISSSKIGLIFNKDHSGIIKGKDQVIEILKKSSKDYEYYLLIQEWEHTLSGLDRKDL